MTVQATYAPAQYTGNGATTAFAASFPFFATSDLVVNLFDTTANQNVSPQPVLGGAGTYDYTITGTQDPNTGEYPNGTVTFNAAPLGNHRITISRNVPATQPAVLTNNAPFPAKTVEGALDRATIIVQQAVAAVAQAFQAPTNDPQGLNYAAPAVATRASQFAGWDSQGNFTALAAPITGTPVAAAMVPFVQSVSLAAALALLMPKGSTLTSATAGSAAETFLTLLRNKGAGGNSDFLEGIEFDGMNTSSAQKAMARVLAQIATATAGSEQGALHLQTATAGILSTVATLQLGINVGGTAGGDKGPGSVNAQSLWLQGAQLFDALSLGIAIFCEQQPSNTASADTLTNSVQVKRTLNTTIVNTIAGCSLSSSQVTLPAGTYVAFGWSPAYLNSVGGNFHRCRLRDTTASATVVVGIAAGSQVPTSDPNCTVSTLFGRFTLAGSHVLELDDYQSSTTTQGGFNMNNGDTEQYSTLCLLKVG